MATSMNRHTGLESLHFPAKMRIIEVVAVKFSHQVPIAIVAQPNLSVVNGLPHRLPVVAFQVLLVTRPTSGVLMNIAHARI